MVPLYQYAYISIMVYLAQSKAAQPHAYLAIANPNQPFLVSSYPSPATATPLPPTASTNSYALHLFSNL